MQQVTKARTVNAGDRASARSLIPLVALGSGLAAGPAAALELGELTVHSNLGQPLRASIAYALAPNEMLAETCVSIDTGRSAGSLPGIGSSTVSVTESAIVITGGTVIREPMLATRVTIRCPRTPQLRREYTMFVDPAPVAAARAAREVPVAAPVIRREAEPAGRSAAAAPVARRLPVNDTPIGQSTRYRVQPGDTLGDIVHRIENRTMSLWPAVRLVFEANPDSFVDNDPNQLKAGSWLTIPSFDGSAPVVGDTANAAAPEATAAHDRTVRRQLAEPTPGDSVAGGGAGDLKPGDVIIDTQVEGPRTSSASPNVPTVTVDTGARSESAPPNVPTAIADTGVRGESTPFLAWSIGGGLAIVAALMLFGRRLRGRHGAAPVEPIPAAPVPRSHDGIGEPDAITVREYRIEDDSPTEENLALDGDLVTGDGFGDGVEIDVVRDFGFAATPASEVELPQASGDDDMAVVFDATPIANDYAIGREIDYDMLEQDYEDALSTTQALNQEIERAAAELAAGAPDEDETSELPLATVTELDVAGRLPAREDADPTVDMDASRNPNDTAAVTVDMSADDETAEMPVANDDDTLNLEIVGKT